MTNILQNSLDGDPSHGTLNAKIVETLYGEALMLADEARETFNRKREEVSDIKGNLQALALSVETLRTTTRVMHMLAWLLNQRAFFAGELSARQVKAFGPLPEVNPSDPEQVALLDRDTQEIIARSESLHGQISRLERAKLRETAANDQGSIGDIKGKLEAAFGG
ncbi:DUF1465 family protein [Altererythrobacter aurantiacus]|uniref:DUF1465 family protein n=1 Tax=Parapontixanthobacter aurantiacus TaxID=1463599 RepID=A0A844ZAJ8_9SPHN|nr:DUF1465 family protein [Parapontixanthobacter aurantiacus]MXO84544.1 DUF1465 family protein [Parapontixanthobacter aurantiacus]